MEDYEGKCLGKANGKIVVVSDSVDEVMATLKKDYPDSVLSISSVPKRDKVFVL